MPFTVLTSDAQVHEEDIILVYESVNFPRRNQYFAADEDYDKTNAIASRGLICYS